MQAPDKHSASTRVLRKLLGENDKHGLRRTNADKRNAVRVMLEDEEWSKLSNCQIAVKCNVGEALVRKMRPQICIDNTVKPHTTIQTIYRQTPTENLETIIAERLAEERAGMEKTIREQGWTQERIGKALGVSKMTVSRWLPVTNVTNQNSDNSPSPPPTENPEQHGFSKGEDFEVFHKIMKNLQGGYSLGLRSKERRGGVLVSSQRKTAQNAADRRGGSGPGHEAQGVLEPQAVVFL